MEHSVRQKNQLQSVPCRRPNATASIAALIVLVAANVFAGDKALLVKTTTQADGTIAQQPLPLAIIESLGTVLTGDGSDQVAGVVEGPTGTIVVAGTTTATTLNSGSQHAAGSAGDRNVFVATIDATTGALLRVTFLGGSGEESMLTTFGGGVGGPSLAVDGSGFVYVTGTTDSTDFPTTPGAWLSGKPAGVTSFVTKLDPADGTVVYSTYLAGARAYAIQVDETGAAHIAGETAAGFTEVGALPNAGGVDPDSFVASLNPAGSALTFASRLGGSQPDAALSLAYVGNGVVYSAGFTESANFPVGSTIQPTNNGPSGCFGDAFVAKVDTRAPALLWSTFLGGTGFFGDFATTVAADASGRVVVAGATSSDDFPTTNALQPTAPAETLMWPFVAAIDSDGTTLLFSTHLAGPSASTSPAVCPPNGWNGATAVAFDRQGRPWVAGSTSSMSFPTKSALQSSSGGAYDAFLSVLSQDGAGLLFSSYLGGQGSDFALAMVQTSDTGAIIAGETTGGFPGSLGSQSVAANDSGGVFLVELSLADILLGATANADQASGPAPLAVHFTCSPSGGAGPYDFSWDFGDSSPSSTDQNSMHTYLSPGTYSATVTITDSAQAVAFDTVTITVHEACSVTCTATAPLAAEVDQAVAFVAAATSSSGCSTDPTIAWTFGDGGGASGATASHSYAEAGIYTWTMTASVNSALCSRSGTITITDHQAAWTLVVPAVAHKPGFGGTRWRSDLTVVNGDPGAAEATLVFLAGSTALVRTAMLPAGSSMQWTDVLVSLFGVDDASSLTGTVHIVSDRSLAVASRTYNQDPGGTFGQGLPALAASDGILSDQVGILSGVVKSAMYRTNVGFANLSGADARVRVSLIGADAAALGTATELTVPAGRWLQLDDVFAQLGAPATGLAWAKVEVLTTGARVWAYASVIDNSTGDPTTVSVVAAD